MEMEMEIRLNKYFIDFGKISPEVQTGQQL